MNKPKRAYIILAKINKEYKTENVKGKLTPNETLIVTDAFGNKEEYLPGEFTIIKKLKVIRKYIITERD